MQNFLYELNDFCCERRNEVCPEKEEFQYNADPEYMKIKR